jgi:plastocyanin
MRTITTVGAALLALTVWSPGGLAVAGTLKGTVQFTGGPIEPRKLKVTVDHGVCGASKDAEDVSVSPEMGLRNVVVSLRTPPPDARWPAAVPPVKMDQQQCVFTPRVVVVPAGGTVEFLNSDRLLHNLHSASGANAPFNRTQPKGRTIPIGFPRPEIVRIDCDLHPWMRAWVVVAEHPYYAVTDGQGAFALPDLPPGRYTLQLWHETLDTRTHDVQVGAGVTAVTIPMKGR